MAFNKTGISISKASIISLSNKQSIEETYEVGSVKDGKVWDGEKWVDKKDWENKTNG